MGTDSFNEINAVQIRATVDFKNLPRDNFIANGQYKSLMTCLYSPTSPDQAIMISVISSTKENNKGKFVGQEKIQKFENNASDWLDLFEEGNKVITEIRNSTPGDI